MAAIDVKSKDITSFIRSVMFSSGAHRSGYETEEKSTYEEVAYTLR